MSAGARTAPADPPAPPLGRYAWLLLLAMFAALAAVAGAWLAVDRHPFEWDYASHLERALRCHRTLVESGPGGFRTIMEDPESFYPPAVFCAAGLLYTVLPPTAVTAQLVVIASLGVGMAAVFALGRHLAGPGGGLLAAFIFGTAPFVVYSTLNFQLDLPLTALVAVALLALVRSEEFGRPGWTLALGAVCGLALLTKPPFPVYMALPIAWVAARAARRPDRRRRLLWLASALALAVAISLPWYGPRAISIPSQILGRSFQNAAREGQPPTFTSESLTYYPRVFPSQLGWLATLAFAWGLWSIRSHRGARAVLWLAALIPVVVFTIIQNKNLRYTLPALAAASVIAAIGVGGLPRALRRVAVVALLALGCLQVSMSAFGIPNPPAVPGFPLGIAIPYPPSRDDWQHARILADVVRESRGQPATVAVLPNHAYFSKSNFSYEATSRGLGLRVVRLWGEVPRGVDFIVLKTGDQGPGFSGARPLGILRAFAAPGSWLASVYPAVGEYALPDGSRAELRARRLRPPPGVEPAAVARRLEETAARVLEDYVGSAGGLRVKATYRPEAILRGEVDALTVATESALVGELARPDRPALRVRDVRVRLSGLLVDPGALMSGSEAEVLDLSGLDIERLTITQDDLAAYLARRRRAGRISVAFDEGMARATVRGLGPLIEGRLRLLPGAGEVPITFAIDQVRVSGIGIPDLLVSWVVRSFDPTPRLRQLPLAITLAPVAIRPGRLEVGGSGAGAAAPRS
ncbi:MAG TPA: LmeA family phospholipid-binding protein [Candidatus Binatia bacterium]|nr:LmeA family phospholipid-binding protein [Candidatus Binatia bacterium]